MTTSTEQRAKAKAERLNAVTTLDTAIEKLCHPYETRTPIRLNGNGHRGRRIHTTHHEALISQLRAAIYSDMGTGTHGGSQPETRSVIDPDAADAYNDIRRDIRHAWQQLPIPLDYFDTRWEPEESLQRWHDTLLLAHNITPVSTALLARWAKIFDHWVTRIETKFEPAEIVTIYQPCPVCQQRWVDADGTRKTALTATVKVEVLGTVDCRACGTHWEGRANLERLGQIMAAPTRDDTDTNVTTNAPA